MRKRAKGFLLAECLIAMAVAALFLPPLAAGFYEILGASEALRQREEAFRIASSCVEITEAEGSAPSPERISESVAQHFASYDISVKVTPTATGMLCLVSLSWNGSRGKQTLNFSRRMR